MTEALYYIKKTKSDSSDWRKNTANCHRIAQLIFHLISTKEQGILLFMDKRRKLNIVVRAGMIVDVQSNYIREDTLGRYLIHQKIITPEQNRLSMEKAGKMKLPQGQVLVTMGVLRQRELVSYVSQHKMRKFLRVFQGSWDGVEFEYLPQNVEGRHTSMEPISLKRMLKLGILNIVKLSTLYEVFLQNGWLNRTLILTAEFEKAAELLRLHSETFTLARWLDNRSLIEVEHSHPDRFDAALRAAYLLLLIQGARLGEETKEPPPVAREEIPITLDRQPEPNRDNPLLDQALADAANFFECDDYRIAKVFLEKAIQIDPGSSKALAMLAWAEFQLAGKKKEPVLPRCKDLIKQAIRIDPNNDRAHLYLGKIYRYENRIDLAMPHFRRANIINPRNEDAQEEIARIEADRNKSDRSDRI